MKVSKGRRGVPKTYVVGRKKYLVGSNEAEKVRHKAGLERRYLEVISAKFLKADIHPEMAAQNVVEELPEVNKFFSGIKNRMAEWVLIWGASSS